MRPAAYVLCILSSKQMNGRVKKSLRLRQYATLRSSAHKLRYSRTRAKGLGAPPVGLPFPGPLRVKQVLSYDMQRYDLRASITRFLRTMGPDLIGKWNDNTEASLEAFAIPDISLQPSLRHQRQGMGDKAQNCLSDGVASDERFLRLFDDFLSTFIIPWIKGQLISIGITEENQEDIFYYQRPPTLRLQPGPSSLFVFPHCDADYGHQDGELNFWMPLTDSSLTETDLWVESEPGKEDFEPLGITIGEVAAFHGSSCRHYVPANPTSNTRVSLDFRVGIKGFFDPNWKMLGTKADHNRKEVVL